VDICLKPSETKELLSYKRARDAQQGFPVPPTQLVQAYAARARFPLTKSHRNYR